MSWQIDSAHSHVQFAVRHMMISTVRGEFHDFTGTIDFDRNNPEDTTVDVKIDASSISTRQDDRDNHLRSPDFLNVEAYPFITFKSKRVEQTDQKRGRLVGDLTIRGVTREVVLDVQFQGIAKSPWGQTSAGFTGSTSFNRKDWGLNWNQALETGGVLVGDKVSVDIELELIKQPETEEETEAAAS
jgi:polyisoprenoid-binding protein YceI